MMLVNDVTRLMSSGYLDPADECSPSYAPAALVLLKSWSSSGDFKLMVWHSTALQSVDRSSQKFIQAASASRCREKAKAGETKKKRAEPPGLRGEETARDECRANGRLRFAPSKQGHWITLPSLHRRFGETAALPPLLGASSGGLYSFLFR